MLNSGILQGRLVRDPEVKTVTINGKEQLKALYSLAVGRDMKQGDKSQADYINCVAFGQKAQFAAQYLKKGMMVVVEGRIQSGSYVNKNKQKVYTTDLWVEKQYPCEWAKETAPEKKLTVQEDTAAFSEYMYNMEEYPDYDYR